MEKLKQIIYRRRTSSQESARRLPYTQWFSYGVGHVLNDLCASMWFTYLLVFYHYVVHLPNSIAGTLVLIGQVADALSTPFCGYECDRTTFKWYGKRKLWHLIGTLCVASSVFFIYHQCITCSEVAVPYKVLYFSCFIIVFQFGWASTQISHLSLIPELTPVKTERVGLNAIRYFFTILSNLGVFLVMLALLTTVGGGTDVISPDDKPIFWIMAVGIIVIGLGFSLIFHLGVREKVESLIESVPPREGAESSERGAGQGAGQGCPLQQTTTVLWYQWFKNPRLYIIGVIYMSSRLVVNLTQLYSPFFVMESIEIGKQSVAIAPLVIFISSLVTTLSIKYINQYIGRYMTFFLGLVIIWGGLMWCWVQPSNSEGVVNGNIIYGAMVCIGAGGTTLLVTALSFVSDMIGTSVSSGAFVYGLMSFADKLSNGIAIQVIQLLHPCKGEGANVCCSGCKSFYRSVIVYVPGAASLVALLGLAALLAFVWGRGRARGRGRASPAPPQQQCPVLGKKQCSCPLECSLHFEQNIQQVTCVQERDRLLARPSS